MRSLIGLVASVFLAACATTSLQSKDFSEPRDSVSVLIMDPEVAMNFMTTSNVPELRADWTNAATENLMTPLVAELKASGETVIKYEGTTADNEISQLVLLSEAVTSAMINHVGIVGSNVIPRPLPHRKDNAFDYTLGDGAVKMADSFDADYAVFLRSRAQFESSGVFLRNVLIAAVTGYAPASQAYRGTYVTLVDLRTGQIVWVSGRATGDPRTPEAAESIISKIMESSPLARGS